MENRRLAGTGQFRIGSRRQGLASSLRIDYHVPMYPMYCLTYTLLAVDENIRSRAALGRQALAGHSEGKRLGKASSTVSSSPTALGWEPPISRPKEPIAPDGDGVLMV